MLRWALALFGLAACDRFLQLQPVASVPPDASQACARSVAVGRGHTCAVTGAGDVYCWGSNESGASTPGGARYVLAPTRIILPAHAVQVGAGYQLSCARLEDGSVWCWGDNRNGQLGTGMTSPQGGPVQVALADAATDLKVASQYACAILATDSSVACWGDDTFAALGFDPTSSMGMSATPVAIAGSVGTQQLAVGHRHNCIVDSGGQVRCWGANRGGQLGVADGDHGGVDYQAALTTLADLGTVKMLAISGRTSCALTSAGKVDCWGRGENGELGNGGFTSSQQPTATSLSGVSSLSLANRGGCALLADQTVQCWGELDDGNGGRATSATPIASSLTGVAQIATHFDHACAIAGGTIQCWGDDMHAELGRGARGIQPMPTLVLPTAPTAIAATAAGACALTGGNVSCWGRNDFGELGDGTLVTKLAPQPVPGVTGATGIAAYGQHVCAWGDSAAQCWGRDSYAENGDGASSRQDTSPALFATGGQIVEMALGQEFTCAVMVGGAIRCAGRNDEGELGLGNFNSPVTAVTTSNAGGQHMAAGEQHACSISSGYIYCWGSDKYNQLGDGLMTNVATAQQVPGLTSPAYLAIKAGKRHTCALADTADVYCWGDNGEGQLGAGDFDAHAGYVHVTLPRSATTIWAGEYKTCAQVTGGDVYCWGRDTDGDLGDGMTQTVPSPQLISAFSGATAIAHGEGGGCAIANGSLQCWGLPEMLGNNDNSRETPAPPMALPCD